MIVYKEKSMRINVSLAKLQQKKSQHTKSHRILYTSNKELENEIF